MNCQLVASRRIALVALFVVLLPTVGRTQSIATTFEELRFKVGPGDTIFITDRTDREAAATIVALSGSTLSVRISGELRDLAEQDVRRIRQRLPDPLWSGTIIGFGIGAGVGVIPAVMGCESEGAGCSVAAVVVYGLLGAGIGVGIDALIKGRKVIYEARGSKAAQWLLSPMVSGTTKGAQMRVLF